MRKTVVIAALAVLCAFGAAQAQSNIGFFGIGGKLGITDPGAGVGSAITFGASANLGTIMDGKIGLQADVTYWAKDYGFGDDWKISQFGIAVIGKYYFAADTEKLRPFAGGGLGFNINSVSGPSYTDPWTGHEEDNDASDTDIGLHIVGGVDYQLSEQVTGFAEFRYMVGGDWDFYAIFVGAIFNLNK